MSQEIQQPEKDPLNHKVLIHLLNKGLVTVKDVDKLLFEEYKKITDRGKQKEFKDLLANDVSKIGLDQATYLELLDAIQIEVFKNALNKKRRLPSIKTLRESFNTRFGKIALPMNQLLGTNNDTDEE